MKQIGLELVTFSAMFNEIITIYMILGIGIGVLRKFDVNEKILKSLKGVLNENKNIYDYSNSYVML